MAYLIALTEGEDKELRQILKAFNAFKSWAEIAELTGFQPKDRIESYANGRAKLRADEYDRVLRFFAFKIDEKFKRCIESEAANSLVLGYVARTNPISLSRVLGLSGNDLDTFSGEVSNSYYLTFRHADADKWAVGYMKVLRRKERGQGLPRFASWRKIGPNFVRLRGFIFKSGDHVFLNGHLDRKSQIWSAICQIDDRYGDLLGVHLSAGGEGEIVGSRTYCLNMKEYGIEYPSESRTIRSSIIGIKSIDEIADIATKMKLPRFEQIHSYLTSEPSELRFGR